jgi:DNA-binding transcriptional ArsR family regulator
MAIKFLSAKTAKVLSNKTAKKILDILDKKKSTSQIAKELDLPLTTVDYNITQLEKAGLIKSGYYKWSKRGNKMRLYEPAGEIFVYAPEDKQPAVLEALNKFVVPVVLGVAGGFGWIVQKFFYGANIVTKSFVEESAVLGTQKVVAPIIETVETDVLASTGAPMIDSAVQTAVNNAVEPVANTTIQTVNVTQNIIQNEPQLWFWFMLVAGLVMFVLYLIKLRKTS